MATSVKSDWTGIDCIELRNVIRKLTPAFEGKLAANPSGRNIKFESGQASLSGRGTTITVKCSIKESFLVPFENLSRIVVLCDQASTLKMKTSGTDGGVKVADGKHQWLLVCDTEWHDQNPKTKDRENALFRIACDEFVRGIRSTAFAKGKASDPTGSFLHDVLFEVEDGVVSFVCTDGRRIALFETEVDQAVDDARVSIPARVVEKIAAIAARDEDSAIQFCYTDRQCIVELSGCTIRFARPTAKFRDWRKILHEEPKEYCVEAGEFAKALDRASVCCDDETRGVELAVQDGTISIKANGAGSSSARVKLHHSGSDCSATLNPGFLTQWLDSLDSCEPVSFDLCGTETTNALFATEGRRYMVCRIEKA